jgi:hypothetical protein
MQQGFSLHEAGVTFWRSRKSYTFFTPKILSITVGFEPISTGLGLQSDRLDRGRSTQPHRQGLINARFGGV